MVRSFGAERCLLDTVVSWHLFWSQSSQVFQKPLLWLDSRRSKQNPHCRKTRMTNPFGFGMGKEGKTQIKGSKVG